MKNGEEASGMPKAYETGPSSGVRLRIEHSRLKGWVTAIGGLERGGYRNHDVGERRITFDDTGIHVVAVDPSHVAMEFIDLPKSACEEYTVYNGQGVTIAVDLRKFVETLKIGRRGDLLDFKTDEPSPSPWGGEKGDGTGWYLKRATLAVGRVVRSMSLLNPADVLEPKVPNVKGTGRMQVDGGELLSLVKSAETISDHVTLQMTDGKKPTLKAEGETDRVSNPIPACEEDPRGSFDSMYPLDFFGGMVRSVSGADYIALESGPTYPLRMEFRYITKNGGPWLEGFYLLANRVEEGDEPSPPATPEEVSEIVADANAQIAEENAALADELAKEQAEADDPVTAALRAVIEPAVLGVRPAPSEVERMERDGIPAPPPGMCVSVFSSNGAGRPISVYSPPVTPTPDTDDTEDDDEPPMPHPQPPDLPTMVTGISEAERTTLTVPAYRRSKWSPQRGMSVADARRADRKMRKAKEAGPSTETALAVPASSALVVPVGHALVIPVGVYRYRCLATDRMSRATWTSLESAIRAAQKHDSTCTHYSAIIGTTPDGAKVALRSDTGERVKAWPEVEDGVGVHA